MPNRVAELESKVAELEATVRGLTEEFVDANERLRLLEAQIDTDESHNHDESRVEGSSSDEVNTTKDAERLEETEESDGEQERDEIIVA